MKRLSSHYKALQQFIDSLTVDLIAESLESISASKDISDAKSKMQQHRFDVLGVKGDDGKVVGYVVNDEPGKGIVEQFRKDFSIDEIVSNGAPIANHIANISKMKRLFVLANNGIDGIVTIADLQKMPVRLMIFGIISLLEMVLLEWIRKQFPHDEWKDMIRENRLEKAEELYKQRQRKHQEIELVDCLQLCDKWTVLMKAEGNIPRELGFTSKGSAERYFKQLENVRNSLAHGQNIPEDMNMDWQQITELICKAKQVTERLIRYIENQALQEVP